MADTLKYRGLTDQEVIKSRNEHGVNVLTPPVKDSVWRQFLFKFRDPLIIILCIAGLFSIGISCYEYFGCGASLSAFFEPLGIFIAILLATGLSFFFELKANREFDLLNKVNDEEPVEVIRSGNVTSVPRRDVVVGDIVMLNVGEEIPADGRLLDASSLNIDESTLTGEPICHKTVVEDEFDPESTYPSDMVLRGTKVMEGHGVYEVTAVGDATENGKVFEAAQLTHDVVTPLDEQLARLGKLITVISYSIAAVIILARVALFFIKMPEFEWLDFITYMLQTVMIAIALIVVSVPEGLPMAVTLTLAYSMRRMLKTKNLVRKMHVCETMGATTVICTDKTGTLTQNQMQVAEAIFYEPTSPMPDGIDYKSLICKSIALNSTAQLDLKNQAEPQVIGNPTEGALLLWLRREGVSYADLRHDAKIVAEMPFTTERKFMATLVESPVSGKNLLLLKGAPEIVHRMCGVFPDGADETTINELLLKFQNQAMRTLGFAFAVVESSEGDIEKLLSEKSALTFLGIVAISDPVRSDVPAAVKEVTDAGIKIKIVTGDTPGTAKEIGRQIGLWHDGADGDRNIITGAEFAQLTDEQLRQRVGDLKIISRARPMDKKRLVEALQANNEVVAVTGDGTNDAPALKTAHVGLSMGDGTSVAKEASDITIIDNSFSSIGRAVMWGRSLYLNLRRFILFQMTVNVAACLIVMVGSFIGMQSPLTVTQMLWVNLIMDTFAAMALSALPPSPDVMKGKPRSRTAFIINRPMWADIIGVGVIFFFVLLGLLWLFESYDVTSLLGLFSFAPQPVGSDSLTPYELSLFFTIFVFLQFWNMFNAKAFDSTHSALDLKNCGEFKLIALIIFVGQLLIVSVGGEFFNVVPLKFSDWVVIILSTSLVLWIGEIVRIFKRRN